MVEGIVHMRSDKEQEMRVCIVHPHRLTCEVLSRTIASKTHSEVIGFSSIEDLLDSSMDYQTFVLYNMFGREKMDRWEGVKWIRSQKPDALIVSMLHKRFFDRKSAPPGADAVNLRAGEEIEALVRVIQEGHKGKSYVLVSGHVA
jgi:DNA-binding NarL/FixJ family response regulator